METGEITVAWCTPPAIRSGLENASLQLPVEWTLPGDPFRDNVIAVLDSRAFGGARGLLEARSKRPSCPVLFVCAPEEAVALTQELHDTDDIALHREPPALLVFRVRRLVAGSAGRDSLTGLVQRPIFIKSMQQLIEDPARMPVSFLVVDLDHFKEVNDTHGHNVGDRVLKEAAVRIARVAPSSAVVGRVGGDEFGILDTLRPTDAVALAEQVREAVKATPLYGVKITVSVGCGTVKIPGQSLFTPADEALYAAKAKGRDCVIHYDDIARRALEQDRDVVLEGFENRTRVIAQRVAELITRRGRKLFEALKEQADLDGLTGLFSRRYFDRRLPFELEVSSDQKTPLTVALLDIDHFGQVNKNHGWPSGDKVLIEVADRVRTSTRGDDWVARYGGEEFCVVMYRTPIDIAETVLERIRSAVAAQPFTSTSGNEIEITVSVGAAQREGDENLEALMERVSRQLLLAKEQGRNRVVT